MSELARGPIDELADRWRLGWAGKGFDSCCTPDVSYEDPVAPDPLRGVDALERHALGLRQAFPDLHMEATAPPLWPATTTSASPGACRALAKGCTRGARARAAGPWPRP